MRLNSIFISDNVIEEWNIFVYLKRNNILKQTYTFDNSELNLATINVIFDTTTFKIKFNYKWGFYRIPYNLIAYKIKFNITISINFII